MPDVLHDFVIDASPEKVYEMVSTPGGLDRWWTKRAGGNPAKGEEYVLWFGPEYDWRARVAEAFPGKSFELEITRADDDWMGTRVRFELQGREGGTRVRFLHTGWAEASERFRISSYCWAMYLRLMKRSLERGEFVEYGQRDSA